METSGYSVLASTFRAASQASPPRPTLALGPQPFPGPSIGHICTQCRNVPLDLLLLGSSFFSNRCKGNHAEGENCKGKHSITCDHCKSPIEDVHYHCHVCNEGDFDICSPCKEKGEHCLQGQHKMVNRKFDEGIVREIDETGFTKHHPGVTRELIQEWSVQPYRLHDSYADLVASADGGCHSCCTLVTWLDGQVDKSRTDTAVYIENRPLLVPPNVHSMIGMMKMFALEPDLDNEADEGLPTAVVAVRAERDAEKPVFWDDKQDDAVEYLSFEIRGGDRLYHSRNIHWGRGNKRRQVSPVVDADDNLRVIGSWLHSCQNGESNCSVLADLTFKPTRLIDVGLPGSNSVNPCLVRGETLQGEPVEYVALSYCWGVQGQQRPWLLIKETLPKFEKEIPLDVLPKTIADAVTVARANKIQYLWVDSICIIQDDPDDWTHEAYRMHQVYSCSLFTIISGTDTATGGLFQPRDQLKVSAAEVPVGPPSGSPTHQLAMYPCLVGVPDTTGGGEASKRAWCYQEELLSGRRVYFSKNQFQWACLCAQHNEPGRRCPGDTKTTAWTPPPYDADILYSGSSVINEWYNIVMEYTSRSITYHSDIFAALAGIAAAYKKKLRFDGTCRYLAGMWENDAMHGILWQRVGSSLARPSDFQAPSWSWLSVEGAVTYGRQDPLGGETDAEFVSCEISTHLGNEFGAVAPGGKLRLRARLLSCEVAAVDEEEDLEKLQNTGQDMPVKVTPLNRKKGSNRSGSPDSSDPDHQEFHKGTDGAQDPTDQAHDEVDESKAGNKDIDDWTAEDELNDSDSDTGSGFVLRSAPWEAPTPGEGPVRPPGDRLDMAARVKLAGGNEFATVFFDGEEEAQTREFTVAYINATERPAGIHDRNGVALVRAEPRVHDGVEVYRRIGFVAFWDKLLKGDGDLKFLDETEKTEIVLV